MDQEVVQTARGDATPATLPAEWRVMRVQDAFSFTKKPRELRLSVYDRVPFIPMDLIPTDSVYFEKYVMKLQEELTSGTYFERGDVLLAKITPSFENGKQGIIESLPTSFGIATTEVIPFRGIPDVSDKLFLFYYLLRQDIRSELAGKMEGTTGRQRLNKSTLEALEIPLPPLAEQRAIAATLRAVQVAREARRREVALQRERKAALMQQLFTKGTDSNSVSRSTMFGDVPKQWSELPLEDCAYVQTGVAKGRNLGDKDTVDMPYLRVANVQDGYLDLTEMKTIPILKHEIPRYLLQNGDIVLTEGGDFDKLGRGFIWREQIPNCIHQNHIFAVRPNPSLISSEYLAYLVQSDYGKAYFLSVAHRTTNLASINSTKLKAFPVLLPPLNEQHTIAAALRTCDEVIAALEREATLHDELLRALLEELMTGRMRVDPSQGGAAD